MPIHDWTRVRANRFHDFHQTWIGRIREALNAGVLPPGYFAMREQITGGPEPDVVALELPGKPIESPGGTAVLVGVPSTPVELDARDLLVNEKKYIGSIGGSCRPDRDFPMFLRWFHEGDLDLDALVTARYKLDDIVEATDALAAGKIAGRAIMEF